MKTKLFSFLLGMALAAILAVFALHFRPPLYNPTKAVMLDSDFTDLQIRRAPKDAEIVFLGDSLVERWEYRPELWQKTFGSMKPANLGVPGSRIDNLLWLVNSGKLSVFHPKTFVVMVGTNDMNAPSFFERRLASPLERAKGVRMVMESLEEHFPDSRLVLTLPPTDTNSFATDHWITISPFVATDLAQDETHLTDAGYEHWAASLSKAIALDTKVKPSPEDEVDLQTFSM